MMRIVLLGAPGSGKGTQAQRLQAKYGVPQVSSGDLLRDAVNRGTELGRKAKAVMDAGQLVSDDIVLGLIRDRLSQPDAAQGFILDGFPRNIDQANSLDALLADLGQPLDAVLLLDVRADTLIQRLAGRRICPNCRSVYNVHTLPAGTTTCAKDDTELFQRDDDKEEVVGKRLEVYTKQTEPLVAHYSKLGLLRAIEGEGELDDVFERMEAAALAKPVPARKVKLERAPAAPAKKSASVAQKSNKKTAQAKTKAAAAKPAKPASSKARGKAKAAKREPARKAKAPVKPKTKTKAKAATQTTKRAKRKVAPRAKASSKAKSKSKAKARVNAKVKAQNKGQSKAQSQAQKKGKRKGKR